MIQIQNSADTAKILISGEIGEGWFDDGFTLEKLKAGIGSDDVTNIELEISSLGGDLIEALAIYDSLKTSNARVKAKIIGSSASAATVIAMGADEIEISENSNFRIHRASTVAMGNVDKMDEAAQELAMWDEKLLNIYQKRTGKRKSQISDLMKQDKWISSSEAVTWGFADRKIKEVKTILNQSEMDTTELKKLLKVETDDQIQTAVEALIQNSAKVAELQAVVDQVEADKAEAKRQEIANYLDDAVTGKKITAEVKDSLMALAKTDFEAVKKVVEAAKPEPLKNVVKPGEGDAPAKMTKDEAVKTYNGWKIKNKVARMSIDNPELYNEVVTAMKG